MVLGEDVCWQFSEYFLNGSIPTVATSQARIKRIKKLDLYPQIQISRSVNNIHVLGNTTHSMSFHCLHSEREAMVMDSFFITDVHTCLWLSFD